MDQFCSRCGYADGYGPDDHPCASNLVKEADRLMRDMKGSLDDVARKDLLEIEDKLSTIYEHLRDITQWHSDEVTRAQQARDQVYTKQQSMRSILNPVREALRARLENV